MPPPFFVALFRRIPVDEGVIVLDRARGRTARDDGRAATKGSGGSYPAHLAVPARLERDPADDGMPWATRITLQREPTEPAG